MKCVFDRDFPGRVHKLLTFCILNCKFEEISNSDVECEQNCEMKRSVLCKLEAGQLEGLQMRALGSTFYPRKEVETCGRIQWKKIRTGQGKMTRSSAALDLQI